MYKTLRFLYKSRSLKAPSIANHKAPFRSPAQKSDLPPQTPAASCAQICSYPLPRCRLPCTQLSPLYRVAASWLRDKFHPHAKHPPKRVACRLPLLPSSPSHPTTKHDAGCRLWSRSKRRQFTYARLSPPNMHSCSSQAMQKT